jgi:transcriptional regulator with XRE-family HTH domain
VASPADIPRDIGGFIRDLRSTARISLRELAERAGVSNPYLSQIERGLRKPSAEVLAQIAAALRVSTPLMYLRAGLLSEKDGQGVLAAVAADPDLTGSQKQTLSQIYETFRRENARTERTEIHNHQEVSRDEHDHVQDHVQDHGRGKVRGESAPAGAQQPDPDPGVRRRRRR